jgi:hypothetical protein
MYQTILLFKLFFSHWPIGSAKFRFGLALLCVLSVILCNFGAPFMLWHPQKNFAGGGHAPLASTPLTQYINSELNVVKILNNLCHSYLFPSQD